MAGLKLGTVALEPKDVAYVRALVRLFVHTEKLSWSFVDVAPYHAVLVRGNGRAARPGWLADFDGLVVRLVDGDGNVAADALAYPLRPEQLREWLKLRQRPLDDEPVQQAASVQQAAPVQRVRVQAPPPAAVVAAAAAIGVSEPVARRGRLFKLRRWPDVGLLNEHPAALRMATLMSRKALSVAQLAALTDQSESACRRFIASLERAGLLHEEAAPEAPDGQAAAAVVAVAPVRQRLLVSLRRHLGL